MMSPSRTHEEIKSYLGCLVEAWCLERGIELTPYGSWTLKNKREKRGAEADECYVFGSEPKRKRRPDLAIEVIWTSGGIDKLKVYRKLGVREVWHWEDGSIQMHVLRGAEYESAPAREVQPGIDLEQTRELPRPADREPGDPRLPSGVGQPIGSIHLRPAERVLQGRQRAGLSGAGPVGSGNRPSPCDVEPGTESQCLPAAGGVSTGHL